MLSLCFKIFATIMNKTKVLLLFLISYFIANISPLEIMFINTKNNKQHMYLYFSQIIDEVNNKRAKYTHEQNSATT